MGDSVGGAISGADILDSERTELSKKHEELKPGEYALDFGRCYACGKIERTEGEGHSYFIDDGKGNKQFVSKECWTKKMGNEIEKHPYISPKLLKQIEDKKRISEEGKAMEAAASFLR